MLKLIPIILLLVLSSCNIKKQTKGIERNILSGKWKLIKLSGREIPQNTTIYIEFSEMNKINGFLGCNDLLGSYILKNKNDINFTQLGTTRMACSPEKMKLETQILRILETINNFVLEANKLMFSVNKEEPLAIFVPI